MNDKDKTESKVAESKIQDRGSGLFSWEEIHSIVKEFIRAYLGGQIKVKFAIPDERSLTTVQAINLRTTFAELISVCAGIKQTTTHELKESVGKLFQIIANLQTIDGITGTFLGYDISTKLAVLEHTITDLKTNQSETENLVKRILDYVERIDSYRGMK